MTNQEFAKRKERAEAEPLIISRTDEGFRVYSPGQLKEPYIVSGIPETPTCTCPDFQNHAGDPSWRCKHVLAVLAKVEKREAGAHNGSGQSSTQQRGAENCPRVNADMGKNGASQMVIKRSISPDGRIDSLSVEFSCSVAELPVKEIKTKALKSLKLQAEIVETFLNGKKNAEPNGNGGAALPNRGQSLATDGSIPAKMIEIGGMNGKWGRRLFITVEANGDRLKLFGNRRGLADSIAAAGHAGRTVEITEGLKLDIPCRVITEPSANGRYVNVVRVLPANEHGRAGR